jgi:hypothetical protein
MTNKRFTLRDYYNALLNIEEVASNPTLRKVTEERLVQLDKKNGSSADRKPTEKQIKNDGYKTEIMAYLPIASDECDGWTVAEINKNVPCCAEGGFSSSKTTALVTQLAKADLIIRKEIKGRAYFSAKAE